MNCKQGDLAVIVRSYAGNEGKIVQCLEFVMFEFVQGIYPSWITAPTISDIYGRDCPVPDAHLRPIRDQDGQDETLTWLDVPSKEIA